MRSADGLKRPRHGCGRRLQNQPPTRRILSDQDFAEAEELYARWHRRELTPEAIAERNDFFRAWIEKVVVSPD